ncbi:MAG: DNA topoisomerase IV, partial [Actinobacteria bacterium]|nr:DNA topoisomerase IV [Actinomycetota bacterium]
AREALKKRFKLTALQADYILETPLRRLTKLSQIEVEKEKAELTATIKELTSILGDKAKLKKVVSDELTAVAKYFGTPRRTELTAA